jgi:hypothetical protein
LSKAQLDHVDFSHPDERVRPQSDVSAQEANGARLLSEHSPSEVRQSAAPNAATAHLPQMNVADFQKRADILLKGARVDYEHHYVQADLVRMIEDPSIKGKDAIVAATIYQAYKQAPRGFGIVIAADGSVASNKTDVQFGPAQIKNLIGSTALDTVDITNFRNLTGQDYFGAADKNHDGRLSLAEMRSSTAYLRLLKDAGDLTEKFAAQPSGLTREEIRLSYNGYAQQINSSEQLKTNYKWASERIAAATTRLLFQDAREPLNSIKIEDVLQGATGDCYFESVLGDLAKFQPQVIRDSIKDNLNGTYTVTFKGDPAHPVIVAEPTESELGIYSRGGADGIWPVVMEKAYSKYAVDVLKRPLGEQSVQDAIASGSEASVIRLLTGHDAKIYFASSVSIQDSAHHAIASPFSDADVEAEVVQAVKDGRAVSICVISDQTMPNGMVSDHAYSVVGLKSAANGAALQLRDPRGADSPPASVAPVLNFSDLKTMPFMFSVEMADAKK